MAILVGPAEQQDSANDHDHYPVNDRAQSWPEHHNHPCTEQANKHVSNDDLNEASDDLHVTA